MQNRQPTTRRKLCLRLMKYTASHWGAFMLGLGGMLVTAATMPGLAALVQLILDGVVAGKSLELMQVALLSILALFAMRGVAGHIGTYGINWVGSQLAQDLRLEISHKLLLLSVGCELWHPNGTVVSRITSGTTQIAHAFSSVVTVAIKDTFTITGLLMWMLYLDWTLALLAVLMALSILLIRHLISKRLQGLTLQVEQALDGFSQLVKQSVENHMLVKLHDGEQYENQRMRKQAEEVHRGVARRTSIEANSILLMQMAIAIALSVIVYAAAQHASADKITAGGFASLAAAALLLIPALRRVTRINESLQPGLTAAESIFSFLDQETEPDEGTIAIERARGELRFEEITFCHGREMNSETGVTAGSGSSAEATSASQGITLTVQPGEMVALTGGSPAAIAALVSLVPRFLNPASGKVLLDGHDVKCLKLADLRANIALVSADAVFSDTIAANIAYGARGYATEARITAVAQAAHAAEFIRKMPQGLQTMVGQQGQKLSSDQYLRIAIARALLKNPSILILDETLETTGPDAVRHVQAALENLTKDRTTLVIKPRPYTLEKADWIVVLDKNGIIESGSHRELLARNASYAKFADTLLEQHV